jgi:BlaI family penicillinase repressor
MEKLTKQEEEVMQAIWIAGENNVKAFLEYMPEPRPPYTTLASTVKNLEKKKFVRSRLIGNNYQYTPVISEEDYKQKLMQGFAQNYFNNSYKEMVNFFIEQKKLKPKELQELIKMIEGKK